MVQGHEPIAAYKEGNGDSKITEHGLWPTDETGIEEWVGIPASLNSADQGVSKVSERVDCPDEWM
jgi:hypothetical protein